MEVVLKKSVTIVKDQDKYPNYTITDYRNIYGGIMQFDKNKSEPIHQWYPFVEGYSREFIDGIIKELPYKVEQALEPFAGSGTTPLELQRKNIACYSFEVSPFMHLLATTKLETSYDSRQSVSIFEDIKKDLRGKLLPIRSLMSLPLARTYQPRKGKDKWVFDKSVMNGILDIKYRILSIDDLKYQKLLKVALASILLEVSNVYRNGKCLSYKKDWNETTISRRSVHEKFISRLEDKIIPDLNTIDFSSKVDNQSICQLGDVRKLLSNVPDDSIDLVITSPPYLNTRDYTDIYLTELWVLDLVNDYSDLRDLRSNTLFSHVQIKRDLYSKLDVSRLRDVYDEISHFKEEFWNKNLLNMIEGYFGDMDSILDMLSKKMKIGRRIYFNVANSAYYGQEILVDEIIAEIAQNNGFSILEIREARRLSPSGQQKDKIEYLRESVIVMEKL